MRSLSFLPYTTKFVRAKPQNYYSLTTTFAVAKPQNLLKPNHTNVRAHTTTFGGHPKLIAKHAKKAESKTLSLVRYAIVEKTKAAYSNERRR